MSLLTSALDIIKALMGIKPGQPKKGKQARVKPLPPRKPKGPPS
jgi:hypothetical protein